MKRQFQRHRGPRRRVPVGAAYALVAVALGAAACGGASSPAAGGGANTSSSSASTASPTASSSGSSSSSSANASPTTNGSQSSSNHLSPDKIKVAYFSVGSNNTYVQNGILAAKQTAKKAGVSLQVFDGQFSETTQANQIQNALTNGGFNAFVIEPDDGRVICSLVKKALSAHIAVSATNGTLCGAAAWMPGTVSFTGGQTLADYEHFVDYIAKKNPQGGQIAIITGPALSPNTTTMNKTITWMKHAHPQFDVVANRPGDYTAPTALQITSGLVSGNPNLKYILTNYSEPSKGIHQALVAAHRTDVKVYDMGGDDWDMTAIKNGWVAADMAELPYQEAQHGVQSVIDYLEGKPYQHFYDLTKESILPPSARGNAVIDKSNVAQFHPTY